MEKDNKMLIIKISFTATGGETMETAIQISGVHRNYLIDALLSKRLIELTRILTYEIKGKTSEEIFGFPDYLKFHSSMTLFYSVITSNNELQKNSDYSCFEDAIRKYYNGILDKLT